MSEPDDAERDPSLRRWATRRLMDTASDVVARGRKIATELREGELRPGAVADVLLMETQEAVWRQLYERFKERAQRSEGGLHSALDALDAMWQTIRQLRAGAPTILHTLSNADETVSERRSRFYRESTRLLEDGIRAVFAMDLGQLAIPPERMAVVVRVMMEGLMVELAQARTSDDVAAVDAAYGDMRTLFERFVLNGAAPGSGADLAGADPAALVAACSASRARSASRSTSRPGATWGAMRLAAAARALRGVVDALDPHHREVAAAGAAGGLEDVPVLDDAPQVGALGRDQGRRRRRRRRPSARSARRRGR
ncbi:MAG: hypothetical protein R3F59_15255 [Myxococcota bacterium]